MLCFRFIKLGVIKQSTLLNQGEGGDCRATSNLDLMQNQFLILFSNLLFNYFY